MITGYYIRGSAEGAWALVEQDERYKETVVGDGLSNKEAVALYWKKMAELSAPADPAAGSDRPRRRQCVPPQLMLKL